MEFRAEVPVGLRLLYISWRYVVCMTKRTTIEIDEELLARAKRALGAKTARATVEEALRRAAESAEDEHARRAGAQRAYLEHLAARIDREVLLSEEMWR